MTRRSKRELERSIEELSPDDDESHTEIVLTETVVGTDWDPPRGERLGAPPTRQRRAHRGDYENRVMTRRSKREIERAIADFPEQGAGRDDYTPAVKEKYPDEVVEVIYRVARDLMRVCHRSPDTIVNVPTDEATAAFLEKVREQYGIADDRDDDIRAGLGEAVAQTDAKHWTALDAFQSAVISVPGEMDLETDDGATLSELIEAGDETAAERLLVQRTYEALADLGQGVSAR